MLRAVHEQRRAGNNLVDHDNLFHDEREHTRLNDEYEGLDVDHNRLRNWVNGHLKKINRYVEDLFEDLRDGRNLIFLLEVLTETFIPNNAARLRNEMLHNIHTSLNFLTLNQKIDLTNVNAEEVANGVPKVIIELLSTIMLHFQEKRKPTETNKADKLVDLHQTNGHPKEVLTNGLTSNSSVSFTRGMNGNALASETTSGKSVSNGFQLQNKVNGLSDSPFDESFWTIRYESASPLSLPYEYSGNEKEPQWNTTSWLPALLQPKEGDARRILLDSFLIYLARLTGKTDLQIGWNIYGTSFERKQLESSHAVVPMMVTVNFDEPWTSVSNAIDDELSLIARNRRFLMDFVIDHQSQDSDSSGKMIRPWEITITDTKARFQNPIARGNMLTLEIDAEGCFRWIYDASRLTEAAMERMSAELRQLVNASLLDINKNVPISRLDILPEKSNVKISSALDHSNWLQDDNDAPQDEIESQLALTWREVLGLEHVGRNDSFFALGGNSQPAIQMIESMRSSGLTLTVRDLFENPVLSELAKNIQQHTAVQIPPNLITSACTELTPDMLPLIDLTQTDIDHIVSRVPGGLPNIQDIYALAPLQEGLFFHYQLVTESDPYLTARLMAFSGKDLLDRYLNAVQSVVDRHDIFRTAFLWENLSTPAQIVLRRAPLSIIEVTFESSEGSVANLLEARFKSQQYRIDIRQAPLLRFVIAKETSGRWILLKLMHHIIGDQTTLEIMQTEVQSFLNGQENNLISRTPFRELIAHARLGMSQEAHTDFFTDILSDVDEPTLAFGITGIHHDGLNTTEAHRILPHELNQRLRDQAKQLETTVATLCHLAWGIVVSKISGRATVVYGTVLFGRMLAGGSLDTAMGLLVNTLPFRINVDDTNVKTSVRQTHMQLARLLEHEHASLTMAQHCSGVSRGTPLFNTLLNYRHNTVLSDSKEVGNDISLLNTIERTNYPITLSVDDCGDRLVMTEQVVEMIGSERICGWMLHALESMVQNLEWNSQATTRFLGILSREERALLVETWNSPTIVYPTDLCMHQLFERQVCLSPDAVALIHGDEIISYAELNARANCLAHSLIELGVGPEQFVAICVARSPAMVIGILAIMKAGGAYLPLDPAHSSNRMSEILNDAMPSIVLADNTGRNVLKKIDISGFTILDPNTLPDLKVPNPVVNDLTPSNLVYIIYTSGSTGKPKGVMVEHRNVVRLFKATQSCFGFDHNDTWCLLHSIAFDFSVWEMWGALRYGGKLVLVPDDIARSPTQMYRFVCEHRITILNQTPSAFGSSMTNYIAKPIQDELRYIIFGGERLDPCTLRPWFENRDHTQTKLVNMYGLTETTVHVTFLILNREHTEDTSSQIGSRIPDLRLYLLDADGEPVPIGVVGELCIGGAGVARGYLNRPELTSERFLVNRFSGIVGDRIYKTGDLARYLPNGNLVFLGRNDHQIKIRGFRIEAGEIEACLTGFPGIRAAAVIVRGEDLDERLVAYVVTDVTNFRIEKIRLHVSSLLPEYMVPSAFVRMDSLPFTFNSKLDTKALPAPDENAVIRKTYEAPRTEIEIALAKVWGDALGIESVSRNDSFFELGGHSLMAIRIVECLRSLGITLTVGDIFQRPMLSDLATCAREHNQIDVPTYVISQDIDKLTPSMLPLINLKQEDIDHITSNVPGGLANIQDIYSLSPLQEGLLFHHLLDDERDAYLLMRQTEFSSRELLDRYLAAVQRVVDRHDILRTAFMWENLSTIVQIVMRGVTVSSTELLLSPEDGLARDQLGCRHDSRQDRIDIREAPLLRFLIAQESDDCWILQQLFHHVIVDNITVEVMSNEIVALLTDQHATLSSPVQFRNFISNVRFSQTQTDHMEFFTEMLDDILEPSLAFDQAEIRCDALHMDVAHFVLHGKLTERLRNQAKSIGVSLAALFHLACARIVALTSRQRQAVFGTVLFGRTQAGLGQYSMGLFINTLPIRINIDETSVLDCSRQTHSRLALLMEHEYASLALAQRCSKVVVGIPLFNTLMNFRQRASSVQISTVVDGIEHIRTVGTTNFPFAISVDDEGHCLRVEAQSVNLVEPKRLCAYMQQTLENLVRALEMNPDTPVRSLAILPDTELTLLTEVWNSSKNVYSDSPCIHQIFEQQVAKSPNSIALVYNEQALTYAELNSRANRLAHRLVELGVGPEKIVAICVARSPAMVVGILAILKAGGAYLPLDPAHSSNRMSEILNDAMPNIVLADNTGRNVLKKIDISGFTIIDPNTLPDLKVRNPVVNDLTPSNLVYIIYTSGSTGKPKGVMVEHRNVVRLFEATQSCFGFDHNDTWCLLHSIAFDFSIWEMWGALRYGGKLVLVPDDIARSPTQMYRFVCEHRITILNQTPSAFGSSMTNYIAKPIQDELRYIIFGGERLDPCTLRPWFENRDHTQTKLVNMYGLTETTVHVTFLILNREHTEDTSSQIGSRIPDLRLYLLDADGEPVPIGVVGELCIGGAGVARGYLNRPELTSERFLVNRFSGIVGDRIYKTGDLARYLPNGNLVFLGRNDHQIKVRGFRIEAGEIEACLTGFPGIRAAAVIVRGEDLDKRLIAYIVTDVTNFCIRKIRLHVSSKLPEYMVPSAFVRMDVLPLTANGKLDSKALPAPDENAVVRKTYDAPRTETEISLAKIWGDVLGIERVSRNDSFFELGGHSLLVIRTVGCLRGLGLTLNVRDIFQYPILSQLATCVREHSQCPVPPNIITPEITELTPSMLPLIDITQEDIDHIVSKVHGGLSNIQDIYALSPLQEGILFHHLFDTDRDAYLLMRQTTFPSRHLLDRYLAAVQRVVDRHDILRTAFMWENLSTTVQIVMRRVTVPSTELILSPDEGSARDQLSRRHDARQDRIDIRKAPMLRFLIARESDHCWILQQLFHHLVVDNITMEVMTAEIVALLNDENATLDSDPVQFRNFIANVRLSHAQNDHVHFFKEMLDDVYEPSLAFDLTETLSNRSRINVAHLVLSNELAESLRNQAKCLAISLTALFHLALARIVSRTSHQERAVFGTVLFGRMHAGLTQNSSMGLFINTLPFRINIDETSISDSSREAHFRLARLLEHEYASLAQVQRFSKVTTGVPLFNTLMNFRHEYLSQRESAVVRGIEHVRTVGTTNFPLAICVDDDGYSLRLEAQAVNPVAPERLCAYMEQTLESLVDALETTPDMPVKSLEILPVAERTLLTETRNSPNVLYADLLCVHQMFEQRVVLTPNSIALIYNQERLTYAELNARANRLAHKLIELGVVPEQIVAICVSSSPALVIGILAILKAGGAYLPLDPVHFSKRMGYILSDSMPEILLLDQAGRTALQDTDISTFTVLDPNTPTGAEDSNPRVQNLTSRLLAYVIYTSGSTGKPKGVMVEHRNVVRLFDAMESLFHFDDNDVWCLLHSIAFDFSVWELFGAFRYGGELLLLPYDVVRSPRELYEHVCRHNVTVMSQTFSSLCSSIDCYLEEPSRDRLRYIFYGGEKIIPSALKSWFAVRGDSGARLVIMYGPTETTIFASARIMTADDTKTSFSPLGVRLADVKIYLLDADREPVPDGMIGEIYIAGAGVSRGYSNQPELTSERFPLDPYGARAGDRMYKTGDLACYLPDGNLAFIRRNDEQIKIRGFRIETGEVEACLIEHPAIHAARVLVRGTDQENSLIAYVVAIAQRFRLEDLRNHVTARLPEYMVPSAFVRIDELPLTSNGKLDVSKLPEPDDTAVMKTIYETPRTEIEKNLARVWSEVLKIKLVGRHDSFFELGGHSLLAVRVIESMRSSGFTVGVRDLFEHPRLSELAKHVKQRSEIQVPPNIITPDITELTPSMLPLIDLTQKDVDRIVAKVPGGLANIQDIYGLSPLQEGIFFHHLLDEEKDPYLLMCQTAFSNRDLLDRYLVAVQRVVDRHDILRTLFLWEELSTVAQIVLRQAPISSNLLTLSPEKGSVCDELARRHVSREDCFDLREAPLLRFVIAQEADGRWILQQMFHHLIIDHATQEIISFEIAAFLNQQEEILDTPIPFRNLISKVRFGISEESHVRFFTDLLEDIHEPSLSFGIAEVHHDGTETDVARVAVTPDLNHRLRNQTKCLEVSLAALFHLAWGQVVSRTSERAKTVFGTVLFGRMDVGHGSDTVMGLFINTLPFRVDLDDNSVINCTRESHLRLARLLEHEHASLAIAQRCSNVLSGTPLFNSLLNYRHQSASADNNNVIEGIELIRSMETTNYPLHISVEDYGHTMGLTVHAVKSIDPKRVCSYMLKTLESLVDALEQDPLMAVRLLEVLPQSERKLLIETKNSPMIVYPTESYLHQIFERQATVTPNVTAVIFNGQSITYAELNSRANQLAHILIGSGVGPDEIVAICVSPSPALVIGILAIWKAGGAYLPLDPVHFSKRMNCILSDAMPRVLLVDQAGRTALRDIDTSIFTILDPNTLPSTEYSNPNVKNLRLRNLAYVIYTSGSTGMPKGVMVEHRNVVRLFHAMASKFHFDRNDVWCLLHSVAFDFSVYELWGAFLNGGKLLFPHYDVVRSPQELYEFVCQHDVTVMCQTFSSLRLSIDYYIQEPNRDRLRYIFIGGEKIIPNALKSWFAGRGESGTRLVNVYGPTETTIFASIRVITADDAKKSFSPLGARLADVRIYLLDADRRPVPDGIIGEIYIAGAGVSRGYLNQPELTGERFLVDSYGACAEDRMYKTGDLACYLPDGNLAFIGRNDDQIKIRGFRIETGEVEACMLEYSGISAATVLVRGEKLAERLIAYVVTSADNFDVQDLRAHVVTRLPEYMVPSAFVRIDTLPLTSNGKLDVKELPEPDDSAVVRTCYEAPQGKIETALAEIWSEQLGIQLVGRYDSFFELGGHSLIAVRIIERVRGFRLTLSVRDLFEHPILCELAKRVRRYDEIEVPPNVITPDIAELTPNMLPLIDLTREDVDRIISKVPGGLANIQDIYAPSPLQDGILFHHLLYQERDAYLVTSQIAFSTRDLLDRYVAAVQILVNRHDILRTAFMWEELSTAAQIVLRKVSVLSNINELSFDDGSACANLARCSKLRVNRIDIRQAPLLRFLIAQEKDGRWILHQMFHHLIVDNTTLEVMSREIGAILDHRSKSLIKPVPFRNLIANVRFGMSQEDHTRFFTDMLFDIDEPSLSFDLGEVKHDHDPRINVGNFVLEHDLTERLRNQTKSLEISLAALFHTAWGRIVSCTSNQEKVVFGTVLFGRMQAGLGSDVGVGLFINTLPIRIDLAEISVKKSLRETHLRLARLLEHEHASLAIAQRCSSVGSRVPLFNTLLNYRHTAASTQTSYTTTEIELIQYEQTTIFPLTLSVDDDGHSIRLNAQTVEPISAARICSYVRKTLKSLVNALEFTPTMSVQLMDVLPEEERALVMDTWNSPRMVYPTRLCIHQLFEQQVSKTPQAVSVMYDGQTLSYAELNASANRLAHRLIELGVGPEQIVAICVARSPVLIIGILAILKAGGAYLPLDPEHSSKRMIDILNDAMPNIILADTSGRRVLNELDTSRFTILDPNTSTTLDDSNPVVKDLTSKNLVYVIYTSGSTGLPKGVMVEHRNVVRLFAAMTSSFHFSAQDAWCLIHSIAFDFSVWELWGPLVYGGKLVIVPNDIVRSPEETHRMICEHNITVMNTTPSAFGALSTLFVREPMRDKVRLLFIAGERLDPYILRPWFTVRGNSELQVVNMYGPTETTVYATCKILTRQDTENSWSPLGSRLPDVKLYVLDSHDNPVPIGMTGELYIGGAGVSRGYLNRPDLTNERFLADQYSEYSNDRVYRTGDLACFMPDGTLVFRGRADQQIKIRGFRIEPGEVEACLMAHSAVRAAVVLLVGEKPDERLIAYIVAGAADFHVQDLRLHVALRLPDYMVPSAFVRIDAFPLTSNGKLNVKALPTPGDNAAVRNTYEAPRGEAEISLAGIWSEQLGVELVSRYDSFFELGGHSLLAMRIIERLRIIGFKLTARQLFEHPVLWELAASMTRNVEVEVPVNVITPEITRLTPEMLPLVDLTQNDIDCIVSEVPGGLANIQDIYGLTPLQEGIIFHHLLASERDAYVLMCQTAFATRELLDRYLMATQRVVDRHDILRTAFMWEGLSRTVQVVLRQVLVHPATLKLSAEDGSVCEQLFRRYDSRQDSIDIHEAPLFRLFIAEETDGRWILHQLYHHLIIDHTTLEVMSTEISTIMNGQNDTLVPPFPFRNLIANLCRGTSKEAQISFFKEMLADVEEPSLAFGLSEVHRDGTRAKMAHLDLPDDLAQGLRNRTKYLGASLAALFHLSWAQVVSRTSGHKKAVFGTVLFGRMQAGQGSDVVMGLFINTLPFRVDIDDTPLMDCARETSRKLARLLDYEHASLVVAQRCSGVIHGTPLFNTLLNYRHHSSALDERNSTPGIEIVRSVETSNYPLTMSANDNGHDLSLSVQSADSIDPERVCSYMQRALKSMLDAIEQKPRIPINSLEVMPDTERRLLIETRNSPTKSFATWTCLHQLFERQATVAPDRISLIYQGQKLTYGEINRRANRLARHLISLGVGPDHIVGICVSCSPAMVIGFLAILKAGGAYLPLDPGHSSKRMSDIVNDAQLKILLADDSGRTALKNVDVTSIIKVIDPNVSLPQMESSDPTVQNLTPNNLAYVLYTSGSTGKPKGVMVEHHNVVRLFDASEDRFELSRDDVWCLTHSIAFDFSIWEFWGAFRYGAKLLLVPHEIIRSPRETYDLICEHNVTVMSQTSSSFYPSIEFYVRKPIRDRLKYMVLGGERLVPTLLGPWFAGRESTNTQLVDVYGLTETTVFASTETITRDDTNSSMCRLGTRLPDMRIYLLDADGRLVPDGLTGEIHIAGAGVARGFLNRPELTSQRFIVDPCCTHADNRMYKTGDLARYLPDGNLVFMGRNDEQVKIRGYRIELGEVAACLSEYPEIQAATVLVRGEELQKRLIAYFVTGADDFSIHDLRLHVTTRLPDYMVPSAFVRMDAFPLTLTGKVDTDKFPEPDEDAVVKQTYQAPVGEIESSLAEIWSELLGIKLVSRYDSFFELGGHSLLAVQTIKLAMDRGLVCSLSDLFTTPVLADLAGKITKRPAFQQQHDAILVRSEGTESPIFFVPTGKGDLTYAFALARHIHASFPIYALPWPPSMSDTSITSMREMAVKMVSIMKIVQPCGPYRILGYSSGGVLGHCIASVLSDANDSVAFLGFIDVPHPKYFPEVELWKEQFITFDLVPRSKPENHNDIAVLVQKMDELDLIAFARAAQPLLLNPSDFKPKMYAKQLEDSLKYMRIVHAYDPQDLNVVIHQFHATELLQLSTSLDVKLPFTSNDFSLGWANTLSDSAIRLIPVPGNHGTMMDVDQNRMTLGDAINHALLDR